MWFGGVLGTDGVDQLCDTGNKDSSWRCCSHSVVLGWRALVALWPWGSAGGVFLADKWLLGLSHQSGEKDTTRAPLIGKSSRKSWLEVVKLGVLGAERAEKLFCNHNI